MSPICLLGFKLSECLPNGPQIHVSFFGGWGLVLGSFRNTRSGFVFVCPDGCLVDVLTCIWVSAVVFGMSAPVYQVSLNAFFWAPYLILNEFIVFRNEEHRLR